MSIKRISKTNRTNNTDRRHDILSEGAERRNQSRLETKVLSICQLYKDGMSLRGIAGIHRLSHEWVRQVLINHRIYEKYKPKQIKAGDKKTDKQGYVHVFVGIGEPGATKSGWMLEHRLVMAKHLDRVLQFWEIIHHKDRDKANNELSNLEITTSAEHATCLRCPYYEFYVKATGNKKFQHDRLDKLSRCVIA